MGQTGKLIVITGATVSGKDTLVAALQKNHPSWKKVVTTTTRSPRPDEQEGIDYHFVRFDVFQKMKARDEFLETVEYAGNYYGTTKAILDSVIKGETFIWRIDASRASKIHKLFDDSYDKKTADFFKKNAKVIYLKLQNNAIRQKHFFKRGMDNADIKKRIKQDRVDCHLGNFKNVIINYEDKLEKTVERAETIIIRS